MERWFTSDLHLGHQNIIKFSGRPWDTVDQMDEALITTHNEYVKPSDHLYDLGDVTLERGGRPQQLKFIALNKRRNGHKTLFLGNHDHFETKVYLEAGFEKLRATWRDEQNLLYSHFPIHPNNLGYGVVANVHGHIHQNKSPEPAHFINKQGRLQSIPYINICVEATNYRPIHFDELMKLIQRAKDEWEDVQTHLPETTKL